uniref:NADH-ubiquinone oxidoreductase chain 4L n=1 Tax=Ovatella vulcani TaxID=999270 RepID=G8HPA0_9EUPU|nr:NADH dehydrogenase subunit 4L [Ovatella vulcani]AEQ93843.1 NADH dehydrogenase subunit 4L [Ovatella vulcani]
MLLVSISVLLMCFFIWTFTQHRSHVLNLLIILEAAMLSVLVFYYLMSVLCSSSGVMFLLLLTFAACEAALGLSLLVSVLRLRGNDLMSSLSSTSW